MVSGVRFCLSAAIFCATIVDFTDCDGLETRIKKLIYNNNGLGAYSFEFESLDGTFRKEDGGIVSNTKGDLGFIVRGEYGYIDPEGRYHLVRYIADDNGYQPQTENDILHCLLCKGDCAIYTYEDVELRRIFPDEFPQDTIRKSGILDPEHLGRYNELRNYFQYPKSKLNEHFEELDCYSQNGKKLCKVDVNRYSPEEEQYLSSGLSSNVDRRRVYCFMLLCFTEDELDRVVASF